MDTASQRSYLLYQSLSGILDSPLLAPLLLLKRGVI